MPCVNPSAVPAQTLGWEVEGPVRRLLVSTAQSSDARVALPVFREDVRWTLGRMVIPV